MKIAHLILISLIFTGAVKGIEPDTLTLKSCLELISDRSTVKRQKDIADAITDNRIGNLNNNWYPAIGINAQAVYNSETVEFSDLLQNLPVEIPSLPLDQYKIWAEINQQIFDGGVTRVLKDIEKTNNQNDIFQAESELHNLRSQVSQVYFSLLIAQNTSGIISSSLDLLQARKKTLQAGVDNGVILPENMLSIEAEEISLLQKITELKLLKRQLIRVLSILTDTLIAENTLITVPDLPVTDQNGIRPEIMVFDQQKEKLKLNEKLIRSADLPKIFAFSQLAYGRPGYNMVSRDFHTFYTIGAGMKWNFLNYGDSKRQQRILEFQQELVNIRMENFNDQLQVQYETELASADKFDSLLKQDQKILELRKNIAEISLSKLNNGTITSSDYLKDMNAQLVAELQLENHAILKRQAQYNSLMIQGKLKY